MKLIRKPSNRDGWYEIDPGSAQRLLDARAPNRPLNETRAARYGEAIKSGEFAQNGEPLIFDTGGALIDGQTRLRGCVLANRPFVSYCVFGINRKLFATLDDGAKRTAADATSCAGIKHAAVVAGAAAWLIRYEAGSPAVAAANSQNRNAVAIARKNPRLVESAAYVVGVKGLSAYIPPSISAFFYFMASARDQAKATEFIEKLASGADMDSGNPILVLRNRLYALRGQTRIVAPYEKLAWMIKAWIAFIEGRSLGLLKWNTKAAGRNAEAFPRFEGDEGAI